MLCQNCKETCPLRGCNPLYCGKGIILKKVLNEVRIVIPEEIEKVSFYHIGNRSSLGKLIDKHKISIKHILIRGNK
jgi:hypothetical protein